MYWLPATIRCTAASSASWPVTGGTGSRPAARIAEIASAPPTTARPPAPITRRPYWVSWPSTHSRALSGLQSGVPVLAAYDTPDWSPDKAREWVEGQLTQYGRRVIGVGAANDGTAAGAISAMRAAGLDPVPPVTGQDAELAAVQRIVAGNQYMTVYKAISQQARMAAELAVRLLRGELGGHPGLLTDRLVDGHVLVARNDPLHRSELGVLAGDRRDGVEARGAHRGDRAGGRAVVGGADADHPAAVLGELALDPLPGLVRAPVRRVVLGEHRHARACQHRGHACLDVCGVGVRRRAVHEQHTLVRGEVRPDGIHEGLALQVAHPLAVVRDEVVERVGHLQGEALVDAVGSDLAPDQGVLLVNGASTD